MRALVTTCRKTCNHPSVCNRGPYLIPQRIELIPLAIEDRPQVVEKLRWRVRKPIVCIFILLVHLLQYLLYGLEIRELSPRAQDREVPYCIQTSDILEARQGAVRGQGVGRQHDSTVVLHTQDRGSGNHGGMCAFRGT